MTATITRSSPRVAHHLAEARRLRAEFLATLARRAMLRGARWLGAAAPLDGHPHGHRVRNAARQSR